MTLYRLARNSFFIGFLLLIPLVSPAQSRMKQGGAIWPELQVEYVFKSTSFFYFRNHYRSNFDQDFNNLREAGLLRYLERVQARLGYEHVFNPHWSGGIAFSYADERTRNILFNEIFTRHVGMLGNFRFTKRFSFEHIARWPINNNGRLRGRLDLDQTFKVGKGTLRPRLSYDFFFNLDYLRETPEIPERNLDRLRGRLDVQYAWNARWALTPYFIRQTDYFIVEAAYDENNNLVRPGGKQNHLTPIWGLELRRTLFENGEPIARNLPFDH